MGWLKRPSEFVNQFKKDYDEHTRKTALLVWRGVILRSPVDTGRFRSNWQIGTGAMPSGTTDNTGGPMSFNVGGDLMGKTVYIVNNLPYARRLEEGWSDQAPHGMVAITLAEVNE
jgi:hypothetical protein